ncbi:unnamed protein product [Ceutorhynchus assimilis]|uniref:Scavenger receptor class B member 1 n=1 Tax=Ceutorhynchus assimilis TaxID=467358 RepID=A0A9N9QF73_9CUCU|nr:unnamed protein product [Ceutorhynchus assimilis]
MVIRKPIVPLPRLPSRKASIKSGDRSEDILLTLRRVSETLGVRRVKELYVKKADAKQIKYRLIILLTIAILTTAWGLASLIYTPLKMLLSIRLEMTPGLPPYEWWATPPDEILLSVFVFNITNSEAFMNGTDKKIRVQEIGPIIYKEKLEHINPKVNPNGTLSYTANRTAVFLPEMNTINLNDTIIVPNLGVLLIPAYFHDSSMFIKLGVNMLLRSFKAQPLVKMTIYDYLWNATDPILEPAEKLAPSLVPTRNVGLLNIIYQDFSNNVTLLIGKKNGDAKFFTIDTYDGSPYLPHFSDPKCQLKFRNASEGIGYPQMLTKDANLTYWRKTLCKQADIRYERDERKFGINGYRFKLMPYTFYREGWEGNDDCFAGDPTLPNGIADVSPCYWGFPIAASFPHFLYGDEALQSKIDGLTPNEEEHGSHVLIDPVTGIPLAGKARAQINLVMKKLWGFPKNIQTFSDTYLPLAWLEYNQIGLPWYIKGMVYYMAVIVPVCQLPFSLISLSIAGVCIYFIFGLMVGRLGTAEKGHTMSNRLLKRESQAFIHYDNNDCEL